MTRNRPHLGAAAVATHDCPHCGQRLSPQPVKHEETLPKQTESVVAQSDAPKKDEKLVDVPDPEISSLPESVAVAQDASSRETSSNAPQHEPAAPHAPEMWLADCLTAIESKVGDFISHFDHAISQPVNGTARNVTQPEPQQPTAAPVSTTAAQIKTESPVMKGLFHASSKNMRLDEGHILVAECANVHGRHFESSINLNDCLTNRNASLKWQAGGNFKASARNARLVDGQYLEVDVKNVKGQWRHDKICLSERISNQNGKLIFLRP